ncbi:hypothetical protein BHM03_00018144 [Ensete ventricosum]|nr:hypothetical protein BHM03_00018144 [Ensete ventricosum]
MEDFSDTPSAGPLEIRRLGSEAPFPGKSVRRAPLELPDRNAATHRISAAEAANVTSHKFFFLDVGVATG